jgi:hypothetical protein
MKINNIAGNAVTFCHNGRRSVVSMGVISNDWEPGAICDKELREIRQEQVDLTHNKALPSPSQKPMSAPGV